MRAKEKTMTYAKHRMIVTVPTLGKYSNQSDDRSHDIPQMMLIEKGEQIPTSGYSWEDATNLPDATGYVRETNMRWRQ